MRLFYTLHWKGIGGEITRRVHLLLLFVLLSSLTLFGQIPAGYYDGANEKTGNELKNALYLIIKDHTALSYDALWTAFQYTDKKSNGKVWDMYSDIPNGTAPYEFTFSSDQCGNYSGEGVCYNREHSFPKSWFSDATPMYTDLFHLYPTDGYVNGKRSNYPFGEVTNPTWTSLNGSELGPCSFPGYSGTVFEPRDEFKGDFARSYFYMATRYHNVISNWSSEMLDGTQFPAFTTWAKNLLLKWNNDDPVSQKELDRNNIIYSNYQHNRNPFIDHPEYAEQIWGDGSIPVSFTSTPITSAQASTTYTYNITVTGNVGATFTITAPTKPTWLTFSQTGNGTATLNGTPTEDNVGNNSVVLNVTDGSSSKTQSFTINVLSSIVPLQFTSTPVTAGQVGATYTYNITLTGNGGSTFTISATTKPNWLTLTSTGNGTATLSGNPTSGDVGENAVVLTGGDGNSTVEQSFSINVTETTSGDWVGETFENMPTASSTYSDFSWTGDNGINWSAVQARTDLTINTRAICLKKTTSPIPYIQSQTIDGGCGQIRFKHQQPYTTTGGVLKLYINGNEIGTANVSTSVQTSTFTVNVAGAFTIKLESNGATQIAIDDVEWQSYSSSTNQLPQIGQVALNPTSPATGQAINVSTTITDSDGTIQGVTLGWGATAAASDFSTSMSASSNVYSATIPAQSNAGTLYYKITATDNSSGFNTNTGSVYIGQNQLPSITSENRNPANPTSADNVGVSATVTDPEGRLSTVQLLWGTASNALSNVLSMTNSSSTYSATIPAQTTGTIVYYKIKATDQEGYISESSIQNYTVSPATGIGDNQQSKITVYPNPFSETLNVIVDGSGSTKVTVMDIIGKIVCSADFSDKTYPINTSNLKAGIYIVKIINEGKTTVSRVVKR